MKRTFVILFLTVGLILLFSGISIKTAFSGPIPTGYFIQKANLNIVGIDDICILSGILFMVFGAVVVQRTRPGLEEREALAREIKILGVDAYLVNMGNVQMVYVTDFLPYDKIMYGRKPVDTGALHILAYTVYNCKKYCDDNYRALGLDPARPIVIAPTPELYARYTSHLEEHPKYAGSISTEIHELEHVTFFKKYFENAMKYLTSNGLKEFSELDESYAIGSELEKLARFAKKGYYSTKEVQEKVRERMSSYLDVPSGKKRAMLHFLGLNPDGYENKDSDTILHYSRLARELSNLDYNPGKIDELYGELKVRKKLILNETKGLIEESKKYRAKKD